MPIAESQLETWAQQGKTGLFTDTYNSIRANLLDSSAPYPVKEVEVFLQGSYGNDTNVWADSDVDIVLKHNGAFYHETGDLTPGELAQFKSEFGKDAEYGYPKFKEHAVNWISRIYNNVQDKKAVFVPGTNSRRNADIVVCQQFRRYTSFKPGNREYHEGIAFYSGDTRIVNYPKRHSKNLTEKHQATNENFKRMVRVFKNMRNAMIEKGFLNEGLAPSYFIEGMLWNVPNDKFVGDYQDMFVACYNWLCEADAAKLTTGSQLHWLVRDDSKVCWPTDNYRAFNTALRKFWLS